MTSKKSLVALLLVAMLTVIFLFRHSIVIRGIEHFTKPHNVEISCLNFSIDWRLSVNITKACIASPIGSVLVHKAIWQPWSNVLRIEQVKIKHLEQAIIKNKNDDALTSNEKTNKLNLPDSLPKLTITDLEIESYELVQPLHLAVNSISSNELSISGDITASVNVSANTLVGKVDWRLSDLKKWLSQAQALLQDNAELLTDATLDNAQITTNLTFNGEVLNANNNIDITSRINLSTCPIDTVIKGDMSVELELSSLNISLDLSQLSNTISLVNCPLVQDYFPANDLPQLSLVFGQKITITNSQIILPELQIISKQNANQSVSLTDLKYKTTGELEVNYTISNKQFIQTKQIQSANLDFQSQGALTANLSNNTSEIANSLKITSDNSQLVLSNLKIGPLIVGNLNSTFSMGYKDAKQLVMQGTISSSNIEMGETFVAKTTSDFSLSAADINDLHLSVDNQFFQLKHSEFSFSNITNHVDLHIKEFEKLHFSGNTSTTKSFVQKVSLQPMTFFHLGHANLVNSTLSSEHKIVLEQNFNLEVSQQQSKANIQIKQQNIIALQRIMSQLENALVITQGSMSASIDVTLPHDSKQLTAKGKADFQDLSVKYQDYLLNNINYQTPVIFDSAGLQLAESTLQIDSVDVGVMIEQIEANVIAQNNTFRLTQAQGKLLNGQFSLVDFWLDGREQQFNVNFQNIDLAQLVALQQQPGIKITGNVDGEMPLILSKQGIKVEDGWMSSLNGGKLTIVDNPSFDSIKTQQPELALLENLDFSKLESNVKLNPDGWVFFDFAIQGNNPDKKQSVNFNYSHQENILSLLESIRLVKLVENKIEQKITQGNK